ncbi:MAG: hypothetical protein M1831_007063 [Alyxoria varia]|nr:MAG: hypothetical protein M1831_007063 [Alyxoria varia]
MSEDNEDEPRFSEQDKATLRAVLNSSSGASSHQDQYSTIFGTGQDVGLGPPNPPLAGTHQNQDLSNIDPALHTDLPTLPHAKRHQGQYSSSFGTGQQAGMSTTLPAGAHPNQYSPEVGPRQHTDAPFTPVSGTDSSRQSSQSGPVLEILLVPGAFLAKGYYDDLEKALNDQGFIVSWFWLPTCKREASSVADDVDGLRFHVKSMCEQGKIIMVITWDYGGFVTTNALEEEHQIKEDEPVGVLSLIFLGGFLPGLGETIGELAGTDPTNAQLGDNRLVKIRGDDCLRLLPINCEMFVAAPATISRRLKGLRRKPYNNNTWLSGGLVESALWWPTTSVAWRYFDIFYVGCKDKWIQPELQKRMVRSVVSRDGIWDSLRVYWAEHDSGSTARLLGYHPNMIAECAKYAAWKDCDFEWRMLQRPSADEAGLRWLEVTNHPAHPILLPANGV